MSLKRVRILCVGDPHFKEDNKRTTDDLVQKVVALVKTRRPHYVVIMGDSLHRFKTINQYASHEALRFFRELAHLSRLIVLIGNHDRPTPDDFLSDYHAFEALEGRTDITIVSRPLSIYDETLEKPLLFVPFVPPQRFAEALTYFDQTELSTAAMLFCHQEFIGSEYRAYTKSTHGDEWPVSLAGDPYPIVAGHIHKYQRLGDSINGISHITYVGTPYQENFGEQDPKTVSLFTLSVDKTLPGGLRYDEERIYLHCREKREVKIDALTLSEFEYDDSIDWKVVLRGSPDELVVAQSSKSFSVLQMKGVIFDRIVIDTDGEAMDEMGRNSTTAADSDNKTSETLLDSIEYVIRDRPALQQILREVLNQIVRDK